MLKFLMEARFTTIGAEGVRQEGGTSRRHAVERAVESVGGEVESFNFAFGEYDTYTIMSLPDHESAAALSSAISSSGAVATRMVVLLTPEEIDEASKRAVDYRAPVSEYHAAVV